jgi:hypothetical protein
VEDVRVFCDRCSERILEGRTLMKLAAGPERLKRPTVDLCSDCLAEFTGWLDKRPNGKAPTPRMNRAHHTRPAEALARGTFDPKELRRPARDGGGVRRVHQCQLIRHMFNISANHVPTQEGRMSEIRHTGGRRKTRKKA